MSRLIKDFVQSAHNCEARAARVVCKTEYNRYMGRARELRGWAQQVKSLQDRHRASLAETEKELLGKEAELTTLRIAYHNSQERVRHLEAELRELRGL